jgi:predicted esterase
MRTVQVPRHPIRNRERSIVILRREPRVAGIRAGIFLALILAVVMCSERESWALADEYRPDLGVPPGATVATSAPIELREGMAVSLAGRPRRAAIATDPIAAQVAAGTWTMPQAGGAVTLPGGRAAHWEPVKAGADGWIANPAQRGGYFATTVDSAGTAVMMLEASGHAKVYVDGEPRVGDPYANGFMQLPVRLHKGPNPFLFQMGQGRLKARLSVPKSPAFFSAADTTAPDLIVGEPTVADAALVIVNASEKWQADLSIAARLPDGPEIRTVIPSLVPLSVRKVGFQVRGPAARSEGTWPLALELQRKGRGGDGDRWETVDEASVMLRARRRSQTHKRTFRSTIDGSVQYYAVVPALPSPAEPGGERPGLVLTLHGAAVEALGQAEAYAPKPRLHIVAPTNRRPYGFDWEDWGRQDAIEVLELAQRALDTDRRRTYLTGHSMGGHGTWHLGVTFPDRFAAIAPSAGWISMWSYAGARRAETPNPVDQLLARAAGPSDTLALVRNLAAIGVYILHGDADDNVPVGQARRMRQVMGEFHPDFAYHERPGAGHWWGSACVDWPPLFAFLESHEIPTPAQVRRVDFVTASPGVSARAHWVTIEAQLKSMAPSAVHLELDSEHRRFRGTTENVARFAIDVGRALPDSAAGGSIVVELDGQVLPARPAASTPSGNERWIWLVRSAGSWSSSSPAPASQKGPLRQGPFKEAFRNFFVLVVGTKGTPEENAWGLARARFDAETFWYRGNGSADILTDGEFLDPGRADSLHDRNVILYGHSEGNAAWHELVGDGPVQVRRGEVRIGRRTVTGDDLTCLFIRPRPGSDRAAVGVVAGTGMTGLRQTDGLPYFTSGVAYPDCLLLGAKGSAHDPPCPIAAGYFGADWGVESGEFAWSD